MPVSVEPPTAWLLAGKRSIPVEPGCDVQLLLGSGDSIRVYDCHDSVASAPSITGVAPGASLRFGFSQDWSARVAGIQCGQLSGVAFVPEPGCAIPARVDGGVATFEAAGIGGTWTVSISACAVQDHVDAAHLLCGSWYASVQVRP